MEGAGDPAYCITQRPVLFVEAGKDVLITGIGSILKNFSGENRQAASSRGGSCYFRTSRSSSASSMAAA